MMPSTEARTVARSVHVPMDVDHERYIAALDALLSHLDAAVMIAWAIESTSLALVLESDRLAVAQVRQRLLKRRRQPVPS